MDTDPSVYFKTVLWKVAQQVVFEEHSRLRASIALVLKGITVARLLMGGELLITTSDSDYA